VRLMPDSLPGAMQPILCCLGERVAGKPTQFLWERAIAANELDWRAITIQLAAEDLPVALAGMHVMRFMGLRFFPSLQAEAARQLAPDQDNLKFVGSATSAAWGGEAWHAWHHWGGTILAWTAEHCGSKPPIVWLHGDSVRCRSLWIALIEGVLQDDSTKSSPTRPKTVLWSNPPQELPQPSPQASAPLLVTPLLVTLETAEQGLAHLRALGDERPALLLVGDRLPDVASSQLSDVAGNCFVAGGEEACRQAARWPSPAPRALSEIEQLLACEAFDFQLWTGHSVSNHLLRDAYDEYTGF
jgi:hypothetical protein